MSELQIEPVGSPSRLQDALGIRRQVFINEQSVSPELEIDGLDSQATHFLGSIGGQAVATARTRIVKPGIAKIERVAVTENYRGRGFGSILMQHVIDTMRSQGIPKVILESQVQAGNFYQALGFEAVGEEFMDAGIPHIKMARTLDKDKAAELGPDGLSYVLTDDDNQALLRSYEKIPGEQFKNIEGIVSYLKEHNPLTESLAEQIKAFGLHGNENGAFLVQGFEMAYPIGSPKSERYAEYLLFAVATAVGLPYGFKSQSNGAILSDITPKKSDEGSQLGTGAVDGLVWHTEDAHAQYNCDLIALLGMRGDPEAKTLISQVNPNSLPPEVAIRLQEANYFVFSDGSHSIENGIETPVIEMNGAGSLRLRYDPLYTRFKTPESETAVSELTNWINGNYRSFAVASMEMLLIDNRTSVHSRSKFKPRYDGTDRWLKRVRVHGNEVPGTHLASEGSLTIDI